MAYFDKFPLYAYDITDSNTYTLITDILRRVNLKSNVKANTLVFDQYVVRDGEQPDTVAAKYYDDPELHWVIITINNITSRYDWPLDQVALSEYVNNKYDDPDAIHHYEINATSGDTTNKLIVASDTSGATAVTNYEHEETENDKKRRIRMLDRFYVTQFVEEFRKLIQR
jgi:hypothetical protein